MCQVIPMRIVAIDGFVAQAPIGDVKREVSLFLLHDEIPVAGDYVMAHVDYAIQTMSGKEAQSVGELYDVMLLIESAMHRA